MSSIFKNVYIDKLDDIVNNYNNTYHRTIKMKPVDVKSSIYIIDFTKENNKKGPKFKVGDHVRTSKYQTIFAKGYIRNWSEEMFAFTKVKNTVPWRYVISVLNSEELLERFTKKKMQKTNQKEFRVEKVMKREYNKLYIKWKGYHNPFNRWIDKREIAYMSEYFPKPKFLVANVKVELDLSNYATKSDLQNATGVDTSNFAIKTDLASLKSDVDNLDIDKLKNVPSNSINLKSKVDKIDVDQLVPVPVYLSNLSDVIKDNAVKRTE